MVAFNKIILGALALAVVFTGCGIKPEPKPRKEKNIIQKFEEDMKVKKKRKVMSSIPPLILPPVYKEPDVLDNKKTVTFSAVDAPLSKVLFIIGEAAGMNIVVSEDVDIDKTVTLNMKKASIKDAIDVTMDVSDTYFDVKGNIIYVKKFQTKTFELPFINMTPTQSAALGGDILGGEGAGDTGITGEFTLDYESDEENNDFYQQIEDSLDEIISEEGKYSINKFTGTLIVTDLRSNIKQVDSLFKSIREFVSKQVSIEAKIMEVVLNDDHQLGVNWQKTWEGINSGTLFARQSLNGLSSPFNGIDMVSSSPISGAGSAVSLAYTRNNFEAILQAMESSGDIEIVSNPKIKVLNGQPGLLSSGNMIPYWDKEVTYTTATDPNDATKTITTPTTTYEKTDVLNGISLGVTPIIRKNGIVHLNIVPVITNIEGEKTYTDGEQDVASAPIINVKEMGTVISARDNSMVVIGGLISSEKRDTKYKTPGLADIPGVGDALFKRREQSIVRRELVIILKINIEENQI